MGVTVWEMVMICSSCDQVSPTAPVQGVSRVPDGVRPFKSAVLPTSAKSKLLCPRSTDRWVEGTVSNAGNTLNKILAYFYIKVTYTLLEICSK